MYKLGKQEPGQGANSLPPGNNINSFDPSLGRDLEADAIPFG